MPQNKISLSDLAVKEGRDEITAYIVYKRLAEIEKNQKPKAVLSKLSKMEHKHYEFWKKYSGEEEIKPHWFTIYLVLLLRRLFGAAFVIKYLEGTESAGITEYKSIAKYIPKKDRKTFESIIKDEEDHEQAFADQIKGEHVRYISFIVLGLADALVEIAGIHAGSLGIYNSTLLTGLAGIVAGAAASISMASAAFAQAKQGGFEGSPKTAAGYTGVSYFISAVILASPYFFTANLITALIVSVILGIFIIFFVSWYNSILSGKGLKRDFLELTSVMLAATVALFLFGLLVRHVFGISV